jgi:excisionase family DNA binding protein
MSTPSTPIAADRLTLTAGEVARLLGISRAQLYKLHQSGRLPRPVYLGTRAPRWLRDELEAWLRAGCPDRQSWQRMRHTCLAHG